MKIPEVTNVPQLEDPTAVDEAMETAQSNHDELEHDGIEIHDIPFSPGTMDEVVSFLVGL